jgi:hypothetical protein
MSVFEVILRLAAVTALVGYLFLKQRERAHRRFERYDPARWTGTAIDVATLKSTVEAVRHDYLAERQPTKGIWYRKGLLGSARRAVARLPYFHDREAEEHAPLHTH